MNIAQIENNLQKLMKSYSKPTFIYDLLLAYGLPKASISRLKKGSLNLSKVDGELLWKKKVHFKEVFDKDLHIAVSEMAEEIKHNQRFVIVTDYDTFLAIDTKTQDKLDIDLKDLPKHYDFFLPWAGMEKAQHANENPADIKAAEKMAKLFDEIKKDNPYDSPEFIHGLNVFLSRLLFCFFAEDTNIFKENQFTNAIDAHTQTDGSDLHSFLNRLFDVLNTKNNDRKDLPVYLNDFPYVNGGLFKQKLNAPFFTRRSRQAIIDSGELNWSEINPDIFGSMFQAVISAEHRSGFGMHYTSVPNIMKVIEPLFLNNLYEEYDKGKHNLKKLFALFHRLSRIKIFDPACGSGNFLIIAYKEIRKLEIEILKQIQILQETHGSGSLAFSSEHLSQISLSQFYGIEIDDFAHEIAQLSLWLAEHQMNQEFFKEFGRTNPTLPLKDAGNIVQGNACRIEWDTICPKTLDNDIYIIGNPPYLGGKSQSKEQKEDMLLVFQGNKAYKELDYIACWFLKASKYISKSQTSRFAFVTTSSVCEGAQVEQLWPLISNNGNEIFFAYKPFNWKNNAKEKAGVTCSIIGIQSRNESKKTLFDHTLKQEVDQINGYLMNFREIYITKRNEPFSELPIMITGNSPYEGGNLMLTANEKLQLLKDYPEANVLIRRTYGADEFINSIERYCLWIEDKNLQLALSIKPIRDRIENIRKIRLEGGDVAKGIANRPHQFRYTHTGVTSIIIIPIVSSSRREYIPIGLLNKDSIILSSAAAIYKTESFVFGIISSKIHMLWVKLTAGRLRGDIRYLSALSYNTFPFPHISDKRKQEMTQSVFRILDEREKHSEKTLAQLYDPNSMPEGLREAHRHNDLVIERCYRNKPFESDEERLEYLFKLYERMILEEKVKNIFFDKQGKTHKKK